MKRLFVRAFFVILAAASFTVPAAVAQEVTQPSITQQSIADSVCQGVLGTQDAGIDRNTKVADCRRDGTENFNTLMKQIINIFSIVVGAVSVIMIIIGGFRYIISGGDSTGVSGAKNTILYAIVGLVIVLFAQILVRFVVANLSQAATPATNNTSQQQAQ